MRHIFIALFVALVGINTMCASVWAQATAQISGSVRDQSGAVLSGVEVTATQTDTGIRRQAVSNETGSWILSNIAVGPYRIEATLPGFRTFVQTGIVLQVNSDVVINPVLEVGQVAETVEVQANATQVETRSTAVGQVIENQRILELPLNGRQVTDLITLAGAAVQTGASDNKAMQGGVNISIAGGQSFGVSYSLDGAMHNNPYDGTQMPFPFPDALQEFKLEASGSSAGGYVKSGGAVNAVTKSGTNEFHGDLFEFVRNYKFNGRNFFARKRDSLKRNQFGGTVGGPIVKNKLFFFGGYQGTKTRTDPSDTFSYVPTPAMLAGDWTAFTSPACNAGRQIALRAPFVNSQVNPSQYSIVAKNITAKLPKAQDECGKVTYGLLQKINELQAVGKIDYQWSDRHSLFGRFVETTYNKPTPYSLSGGNILTTASDDRNLGVGLDNLAQSYALGSTYLIGPSTVNAFRLTVNRTAIYRLGAHFFGAPEMGVKAYSSLSDNMRMDVTGGFSLGRDADATFRTTSYQMSDDVSLVRGTHQMAFGGNVAQWRTNQWAANESVGIYTFNGTALGMGMADFLLGRLTTMRQGSPTLWSSRQSYLAMFAADTWKVTPKVTFSYGMRWEPWIPIRLTQGAVYHFDDTRFTQGIKSTVYPNAPAGLYFLGDPGFPENSFANRRWNTFAPRVGLAWDVQGNGRTSVRTSYGYSYDLGTGQTLAASSSAPPWALRTMYQSPPGGFEDPWAGYEGGNPFPYIPAKGAAALFPTFATYAPLLRYNMTPPATQSWNLSVQRQITDDLLVSASYLGSHTTHLWMQRAINQAVYLGTGPCTIAGVAYATCSATNNTGQRRRLFLQNSQQGQYYGIIAAIEDGGSANYNGLLLTIQRRAARGVNVGANYTWSHCLGDEYNAGGAAGGGYLDPYNRRFDYGNCSSDRRRVLNLTAVADTPQFANPTLRLLATGWRLSGIYRNSTGSGLTIATGLDRRLNGDADPQRASQIIASPFGDRSSIYNYLNPAAFAQPAVGTFGNTGRASIEGPGTWQFDLALSRNFAVREAQKLEFRTEAFNVTNSLRPGNPTTNLNQNTFGQITSSFDARIMQFALKYTF
jgi:Carboxypeptidase regulatory-like domain